MWDTQERSQPTNNTIPIQSSTTIPSNRPWASQAVGSETDFERSWRSKFLKMPVLILGISQLVLTLIIISLEIASLAIFTLTPTGAGIWCSISFIIAAILTIILAWKRDGARFYATRVFIAQIFLLVFTFILIGIDGNFVSTNSSAYSLISGAPSASLSASMSSFVKKYQIMQAQLALAIILMFSGFAYLIYYIVATYLAIWKPFNTLDKSNLF